jgi:hypothetical protein
MINTFITSYKVSFAQNANALIFFLKRIPLLGKKIPEKLYKHTQAKFALGILSEILGLLKGFIKTALYLGLVIILPAYLMDRTSSQLLSKFFYIFFILSFMLSPIAHSKIFSAANKPAYDMIILMRADAREYYLSQIIYTRLEAFFHSILPFIIIGLIIGFSPIKAVIALVELTCFRIIGEFIYLYYYKRTGRIFLKRPSINSAVMLLGIALAYVPPILGYNLGIEFILFNVFSLFLLLCLGSASFIYLWGYKDYTPIAKEILTKFSLFNPEEFKATVKFADVKLDEKKMNKEVLNARAIGKKSGYDYLNYLFYLRHKQILVHPIRNRVILVVIAFLISLAVILFLPDKAPLLVQGLKKSTPSLVFLMYLISTGERICKALFYNCDSSLLKYGYYRERGVILSNFTIRLRLSVLLNIIPAFALCLCFSFIFLLCGSGNELVSMLPLFLCIICLACFFSIHHLFMYYAIQPYTAQLTVKSPLYKFSNGVIYFLSYICLQVKTSSYVFTLGVLIVTIFYMSIALIVTYKVAPKTFRLR